MFSQLRTSLEKATAKVAANVARKYQCDGIYGFALYTSGEYGYVIDSFSTAKGLTTVAEKYLGDKSFQDEWGTLDVAMRELKWSPCDSPNHGKFERDFKQPNEQLEAIWSAVDSDSDESYFATCRQIHEIFTEVLLAVRQSDIFDETVVLNVLMGDQSDEERFLNAEPLNSEKVLQAFRSELHCHSKELANLRKHRWKS